MMVYVVLNTMIWVVVRLTNGRVTPSNWHEKEVYDWGMGTRDVPRWMKCIKRKLLPSRYHDEHKDGVELVDNDSALNAATDSSSRGNSAEEHKDSHIMGVQAQVHAQYQVQPQLYPHPHPHPQPQPQFPPRIQSRSNVRMNMRDLPSLD